MTSGRCVILFGSDGTGKTTQALLLTNNLKIEGLKTKRVWIRGRHTISFLISRLFLALGYKAFFRAAWAPGGKVLDSRSIQNKKIWSFMEFISVLPLIISRVYLPILFKRYIVAERYVVDTVVYNEYFIGDAFNPYARMLLRMIPKGSVVIHLDASINDVLARRPHESVMIDFINFQLEKYRILAKSLNAFTINTSILRASQVNQLIMKILFESNFLNSKHNR